MSLKTIYTKTITVFTLLLMLWDTFGWFGSNLLFKHSHSEKGEHHCVVSFCTCITEDDNSICTCHHPELHKKMDGNKEGEMSNHHSESEASMDMCYFSASHPKENSSTVVVVWSDYHALFLLEDIDFGIPQYSVQYKHSNNSVVSGFELEIYHPPKV